MKKVGETLHFTCAWASAKNRIKLNEQKTQKINRQSKTSLMSYVSTFQHPRMRRIILLHTHMTNNIDRERFFETIDLRALLYF